MSEQTKTLLDRLKNKDLLKTACLIDNEWVSGGNTISVVNPFNKETIATVPSLDRATLERAIDCAAAAQDEWAAKTAQERGDILHKWADLIDQNQDDLALIMTYEQGKPLKQAKGEIAYGNGFIRFFAEEGQRIYGDTIPTTKHKVRYLTIKQPIGVCAAITPWNFPSAMITRKAAPALAAGCTMIVKPASQTPLSALALAHLAKEAGLPKGVLQIVTADAKLTSDVLCQSPVVKKLSFTGSTEVGRKLIAQCADTVKKLSMELGGNAPFIIFDDTDLDKAAEGLIVAKYRNAGQVCTAANRVFVQNTIKDKFLSIYKDKVKALTVGNGLDNPDIGAMINDDGIDKAKKLLKDAVDKGAKIILGGDVDDQCPQCFAPTIITEVTDEMTMACDELFAPITAIYGFDEESEVIARANNTIYGLASYFYTNDMARSFRLMEALEYGMVAQNTGSLSNAVAPFGGVKQSGFGREGSKYGIDEYVNIKYWCVDLG